MFSQERWNELLEIQERREIESVGRGISRFRKRVQRANEQGMGATVGGQKTLLSHAIDPIEKGIIAALERKGRGKRHAALKWCRLVGPDVAAYITAREVLNTIYAQVPQRAVALSISSLILDELRYRRFMERSPGLFKYRMNRFNTSSYAHMSRSLNAAMNVAACDACRDEYGKGKHPECEPCKDRKAKRDEERRAKGLPVRDVRVHCPHLCMADLTMSMSRRLLVGTWLIDVLIETTGLVEVDNSTKNVQAGVGKPIFRQEVFLVPSEGTVEWLTKRNGVLETLHPVNRPMVVPPLKWGKDHRGGYRFAMRGNHPLIRAFRDSDDYEGREMPLVYNALNRMQETPWVLNRDVLELVRTIFYKKGGGIAGIPESEETPEPPKPVDIETNDEARRQWKKQAHRVKEQNHIRKCKALEFVRTMGVARSVEEFDAFWFPWNLDFRGRAYPISDYLSPQGDDLQKALLKFAQGKPLGADGDRYLAIHGMNSLGKTPGGRKVSHMTLEDRVRWIEENEKRIRQVAEDPFSNLWWAGEDVEDPLQFYAFACEWVRMLDYEGPRSEFVSSLPVAQDGTCNGLQHFSAMLRDPVGGAAVNLMPVDRLGYVTDPESAVPQDVYAAVANEVEAALQELADSDKLAARWLYSKTVDRNLTKRPTMTFGYGSKTFGFRKQLVEYIKGRDDSEQLEEYFDNDLYVACGFMAKLIMDSLRRVVRSATTGMDFLQECASIIAKEGRAVEWVVPITGFKVKQQYWELNKKQVKTILAGKVIQPSYYEETDKVKLHKQTNAVAPNVVHSLDAAAMMLTVNAAADDGIECFGMVHDSYATLAGDAGHLSKITRESFVRLYREGKVLQSLYQQFVEQSSAVEEVDVPEPGKLDLSLVLVSPYFFN